VGQPQEMLFVLEVSGAGRLFSVRPDGSDKMVIATGCKLPDGVVVDVEAGHVYWTNMGNPSVNDGSIERADLDGSNQVTIGVSRVAPGRQKGLIGHLDRLRYLAHGHAP
jgi:hypothetical protein